MASPPRFKKLNFGVEVEKVQEVIRYQEMTRVPLAPPVVQGLINLRGQIIPALDPHHRLEMKEREEGQLPMNVVVRTADGAVSLLVEEISDVLEASPRDFESPPDNIKGVTRDLVRGVYKLDKQLLLILDTDKAIEINLQMA